MTARTPFWCGAATRSVCSGALWLPATQVCRPKTHGPRLCCASRVMLPRRTCGATPAPLERSSPCRTPSWLRRHGGPHCCSRPTLPRSTRCAVRCLALSCEPPPLAWHGDVRLAPTACPTRRFATCRLRPLSSWRRLPMLRWRLASCRLSGALASSRSCRRMAPVARPPATSAPSRCCRARSNSSSTRCYAACSMGRRTRAHQPLLHLRKVVLCALVHTGAVLSPLGQQTSSPLIPPRGPRPRPPLPCPAVAAPVCRLH